MVHTHRHSRLAIDSLGRPQGRLLVEKTPDIQYPATTTEPVRMVIHLPATQDHQRKAEPKKQPGITGRVQHPGRHGGNTTEPWQVLWQKYFRDRYQFRERPGIRGTGRRVWLG